MSTGDKEVLYEEKAKVVYQKYDDLKTKASKVLEIDSPSDSEEYKKAAEEYRKNWDLLEGQQDIELKALYKEIYGAE